MVKSELIEKIMADNPSLSQRDAEKIVQTIFDEIMDSLARGERVELRGFAAFTVRHRDARRGRNPRTGELVDVPAKPVPYFRAGKEISERLQQSVSGPPDNAKAVE